jgi:hypothetical protein
VLAAPITDAVWHIVRRHVAVACDGLAPLVLRAVRAAAGFAVLGTARERRAAASANAAVSGSAVSAASAAFSVVAGSGAAAAATRAAVDDMLFSLARLLHELSKSGNAKSFAKFAHVLIGDYVELSKLAPEPLAHAHWRVLRLGVFSVLALCTDFERKCVHLAQDEAGRVALRALTEEARRFKYVG